MKKLGKVLLWTVGILVALLILLVIGIKLFFPVEKAKAWAVEEGSAAIGRDISVEGLDISIWGGLGVVLEKVRVANPAGFEGPDLLAAETIDLKLQLLPLLTGEYKIDRLIITRPEINLIRTASGAVNYSFESIDTTAVPSEVADLPPEGKATALAISFDELEIAEGLVHYKDDSSGASLDLLGVSLSSSLVSPNDGLFQGTGRFAVDSVMLVTDDAFPVMRTELSYDLQYNSRSDLLTIDRANLQVNDLRLKSSGKVEHLIAGPKMELGVRSDQNNLRALLSLLPPQQLAKLEGYTVEGNFDLDVDVIYDAGTEKPELLYTGASSLSGVSLASAEIPGTLKFDRCLFDFKPDNLRMTIENGSFDGNPLKGHLVVDDFADPHVSGELAGSLNLKIIEPFLPAEHDHHLAGASTFELKIGGPVKDVTQLDFSGTLSVTNGSYESNLLPEPINSFSLDAYFDKNLVNVRRLDCNLTSGNLAFTGRLNDLVPYLLSDSLTTNIAPSMEATVVGNLDLAIAAPYLPPAGSPRLSGNASIDARFQGSMANLTGFRSYGQVKITDASYSDSLLPEPVEQFQASLRLKPDTIVIEKLAAQFTSSDVNLKGDLIRPFPYLLPILDLNRDSVAQPLLRFEITSHRFDVDRLFPEAVPGSGIDGDSAITSVDSVSTIIMPAFEGLGTVAADTVVYCKVELTDVRGKVHIRDRKIECYDVTTRVYTGSASGKTTIDLSDFDNPRYTGEFEASNIEADDFVSRFTPFGGHLFGKANITKSSYDASGWEPDAFLNSLTFEGDMNLREGKLVTSGALYDGLNQVASYVKEPFSKEQTLRDLANKVSVANGRVTLDEIVGDLDNFGDFVVQGSYGFDNTLDYTGSILLNEKQRRKLGFHGDKLMLPLSISGTVDNPNVKIDVADVMRQVAEDAAQREVDNLKDKAKDALKGLFKK